MTHADAARPSVLDRVKAAMTSHEVRRVTDSNGWRWCVVKNRKIEARLVERETAEQIAADLTARAVIEALRGQSAAMRLHVVELLRGLLRDRLWTEDPQLSRSDLVGQIFDAFIDAILKG